MARYVIETTTQWKCLSCEQLIEEPEDDPIYECPECGDTFRRSDTENENHRSPCCGKFSSKQADQSCPECNEGVDGFEEVDVFLCPSCDDGIEAGAIGTLQKEESRGS